MSTCAHARRSWWGRKGPEIAGGLAIAGAVFAGIALWYLPQDLHAHHQAQDLLRDGTKVTSHRVRVHVEHYRRSTDIDEVEVTYAFGGRQVTTSLAGMPSEPVDLDRGWQPAPSASRYSEPLDVLVSQTDPTLAMAVVDVVYWREDPTAEDLTIAIVGLSMSAAFGVVVMRIGRHKGRHRY